MDSFLQVFFTKNQLYKIARWRISREKAKYFRVKTFVQKTTGKFQEKTEAEHILILSYAKTPELQWLNTSGWCPLPAWAGGGHDMDDGHRLSRLWQPIIPLQLQLTNGSSIIIQQFIINTICAFLTTPEYSTKTNTTGNVINWIIKILGSKCMHYI